AGGPVFKTGDAARKTGGPVFKSGGAVFHAAEPAFRPAQAVDLAGRRFGRRGRGVLECGSLLPLCERASFRKGWPLRKSLSDKAGASSRTRERPRAPHPSLTACASWIP